jgi:NAD(P)-dependent dehydrogenase (short-subunit alcohol dehydrogenase family)
MTRRLSLAPPRWSTAALRSPEPERGHRHGKGEITDLDLNGKLALVSGSTAGIGLAIATALAREGARVIVNGRAQPSVDEIVAKLRSTTGGDVRGFAGDLSVAASAEELARTFPDVEILVNNLGIFEPKPFEDIPDADWMRFFDVNVVSGVRLARLFLPAMKRADWGRIIFISSESAVQIPAEMIHYGVTKTAQIAVARGLAEAVAGTGITVNSILPGPTKSRGVGEFVETLAKSDGQSLAEFQTEFFEKVRPTSLIKRFASPEEVASLVAYIASPLASATTGAALRVDGGVIKSAF